MNINTKNLAKVFKALSDENRLKILSSIYTKECKCNELSCRNESCIKDLSKSLNITVPTISHHIKELVNAGLITTKKEGRWVYCRINQRSFKRTYRFLNKFLTTKDQNHKKTN